MRICVEKKGRNPKKPRGFTLLEIMLAVFIIGVGFLPVMNLFLTGTRSVEKGGVILEANIAAQNIIDRAKSDSFLWDHIPLEAPIPDPRFPEFSLPAFFVAKYKASGTISINPAPGHTVIGTGMNEENLIQIVVTINWNENQKLRTSRLLTYRANTNSFLLKTSTRF